MSIVHIPFYPSDWLAGTVGLSDAERGVYITLFCLCAQSKDSHGLIYLTDKEMALSCRTTKASFKKSLKQLKKQGFVYSFCGGHGVGKVWEYLEEHQKYKTRPAIPLETRQAVYDRDEAVCVYCGDGDTELHIDHIYPWSRGGTHHIDNLALACPPCNLSKGAKTLDEWEGRK